MLPAIFCILFYWRSLGIWFRADDFAWLGLRLSIHRPLDLWNALFSPMAQGTIRFFSERAFFLTFEKIFGLEALPFRIALLAALIAACILLASVTRKLTGSAAAGAIASILWIIQGGLAAAMGWLSSAANQVFCALALLVVFWAFLERRPVLCWIAFLVGFGTLETIVVVPVLLLAYTLCLDRPRWKETLPFWVPSIAFMAFRLGVLAKLNTDAAYVMHFAPSELLYTLKEYLRIVPGFPIAAAAAALLVWRVFRRDWLAIFGTLFFLLLLGPVLPLRNHVEVYYLAVPGMALAFLLALLLMRLVTAGQSKGLPGWLVAGAAALAIVWVFVAMQVDKSYWVLRWHKEHAAAVRNLVRGIVAAESLHKGDTILLTGISNQLFWDGVFDNPWRLYGVGNVYLAPGAEREIDSHPEWGGINEWVIPPATVRELFKQDRAVVYAPKGDYLSNVTGEWRHIATKLGNELSPFVDLGDPAFEHQVGEGWYALEGRSRWMGRRASVQLGVPKVFRHLLISAYCPRELLDAGPVLVRVRLDTADLGEQQVMEANTPIQLGFPIPEGSIRTSAVRVEVEVSRTFRPPADARDLSIVFGTIQIQ